MAHRPVVQEPCYPPDITRIVDGLTHDEMRTALVWFSGACPRQFEAVLLDRIQPARDRAKARPRPPVAPRPGDGELWLGSDL